MPWTYWLLLWTSSVGYMWYCRRGERYRVRLVIRSVASHLGVGLAIGTATSLIIEGTPVNATQLVPLSLLYFTTATSLHCCLIVYRTKQVLGKGTP